MTPIALPLFQSKDSLKLSKPLKNIDPGNELADSFTHLTTGKTKKPFETLVLIHVLHYGFFPPSTQQNNFFSINVFSLHCSINYFCSFCGGFCNICFAALQEIEMEKLPRMKRVWCPPCSNVENSSNLPRFSLNISSILAAAGSNSSSSQNLWVSGLSSNTKAADLKNLFGKYGKVWSFISFACLKHTSNHHRNSMQSFPPTLLDRF